MSDILIMEALARIEFKLDQVMKKVGITPVSVVPMSYMGVHNCPACGLVINHQIDFEHNVVKRVCGCSTGKQPITLDLTPAPTPTKQTEKNDAPEPEPSGPPRAQHGRGGQAR